MFGIRSELLSTECDRRNLSITVIVTVLMIPAVRQHSQLFITVVIL